MLRDKLEKYRKKRITSDELFLISKDVEEIYDLVDLGILVPVKSSGTNGDLLRPLYKKYTIALDKSGSQETVSEIQSLHPKLTKNGYLLKKTEVFLKNREILAALNAFLESNKKICPISRRERSFLIFGDEKILDNNMSLMNSLGLSETDLAYYTTPELCFPDYIPERKPDMTLLICENKDIWFNIRRLMTEDKKTELFGIYIDGVIFGQGNDVTGKGKFSSYAHYLGSENVHFLYCGDIDRAGFDMFCRLINEAAGLDIRLFVPIYRKMLELAETDNLPDSGDGRRIDVKWDRFLHLFTEAEKLKLVEILEKNKRLPQEIINYTVLKENMR
ncbi:MAG: hypothetical protein ACI4JB_03470 [Porcipelethomonas sp.]